MSISSNYDYYDYYNRYTQYNNQTTATTSTQISSKGKHKHKNELDSLVDSGTITSDQEKAIEEKLKEVKTAFESAKANHRMPPPPKPKDDNNASNEIASTLSSLVTAGTLTQTQSDAISTELKSAFGSDSNKVASTTASTSTTATTSSDLLDSLVSDGTITKDQESAIKDAFDSSIKSAKAHHHHHGGQKSVQSSDDNNTTDTISDTLSSLVTAGTINQDQNDTILSALQSAMNTVQSSETQTSTEYDPLDSLVTAGTITKDQQSAVKNAFQTAMQAYQNESYSFEDSFLEDSFNVGM